MNTIKIARAFILLFGIGLINSAVVEAKEWRGIIPLHSTRADVERLLGRPSSEPPAGKCACFYDLGEETATFLYTNGLQCGEPERSDGRVGGWRVPQDTVVEIFVYFKSARTLTEFKIDETKFKKVRDPEMTGLSYYTDGDEGVTMAVGNGIKVYSMTYFHSAKDEYLRCSESPPRPKPCVR